MPITLPVHVQSYLTSAGANKRIFYPQVMYMQNKNLEQFINQSIVRQTQTLIDIQVGDSPSTVEEMLGTFEIKNNQRNVLSLNLSNYTYHQHAAHGMTYIKSLTFDLENGKQSTLKDLFKPTSDFVHRLSTLIKEQIKQREIPLLEPFTQIKPNQDFYIADKTLVIYFQLYEITPYVYGFPMFPISVYNIQDIIDEDGPLSRMVENN